jgi:glycosyltransferase involved in cell wall biosynthesis
VSGGVALVTEVAAPYRIPVFNELAALLDGRLDVIFIAETESRRDWRLEREKIAFSFHVLGGVQFSVPYRGDRQPVYVARPLLPLLVRKRYRTVVLGGWNHVESVWAWLYSRVPARRLVLWSETPLLGEIPRRPLRSAWKRVVIAGSDACVVPGPSAAHYLVAHGADPGRISVAPNAVDTEFWSDVPAGIPVEETDEIVLLYSGRLVASKGLDTAFAALANSRLAGQATLLVAGDGPQREALEAYAPSGVQFLGPQTPAELRALYRRADMLVFPSRYDPWGLVVNEAACASLAAIASDGAGVTRDLLRDGENALVFRGGDVDALRRAFDRLADDRSLATRLGNAAAKITLTNTPAACAAGLLSAIEP